MIAEIITVGTEILMGQILNTNAQYMAQKMSEWGINLYHQSTVGDNMDRLTATIREALSRADVVILSGGLGPTEDDLTKWAVADVLGVPMEEDAPSRVTLEQYFVNADRKPTPNNYRQVLFPKGAKIIPNQNGTAPGCICEIDGKAIIVMPGPPHELRPMLQYGVLPYLEKRSNRRMASKVLRVFGIGESAVEHELKDLIDAQTNPTIAPYAKLGEVSLRITASVVEGEDPMILIQPVVDQICERLGDAVYSCEDESLPELVARLAKEKSATIAVAESISGGLISSDLVDISGASKYFLEGVVCYTNAAKIRLGVSEETLQQHTAVSAEVAKEMANAVRIHSGADFGVSVTGVAGPGDDEDGHPAGLMYVGIANSSSTKSFEFRFTGQRARLQRVASLAALDELRKALEEK